jgi:hypothetical protein
MNRTNTTARAGANFAYFRRKEVVSYVMINLCHKTANMYFVSKSPNVFPFLRINNFKTLSLAPEYMNA